MTRGFERGEFERRVQRAQAMMAQHEIAALLLSTETDLRYFSGFLTRFWESPTRPWYMVIPASGPPIAVIPSIGAPLMAQTWIEDIRTWVSPDLTDDGISLLIATVGEVAGGGKVGVPDGHETHVRIPYANVRKLAGAVQIGSDHGIMRQLRMVKSPAELAKIETAATIAGRAFARVPEIARAGVPLDEVFRKFQMLCLEEGADWVPYLAGGAERGGYADVISPARATPLQTDDVLMLDTGLVWDGYFCDFDRNWSVGAPTEEVRAAYRQLMEATESGFEAAREGATASDVYHAMNGVLSQGGGETDAGRLGHGLGMSLTEWPSLIATDHTELVAGMVLTLEPGIAVGDKIIVHEENIVITNGAARMISPKAPQEMSVI